MTVMTQKLILILLFFGIAHAVQAQGKALKVYILAGQSNMEGHARVGTMGIMADDPKTSALYKDMVDEEGKPVTVDNVYISGGPGNKYGKLAAGFGASSDKIGPEYTFGLCMQKHLNEPILIIKTAWGGKNLHSDFRPPSADPEKGAGEYYLAMINHVKEVLADIKKIYPEYKEEAGYSIVGFVWFQGYNDLIDDGVYPKTKTGNRFQKYSDNLAHLIRDVRKDLDSPKMKFVIGVMGIYGEAEMAKKLKMAPRRSPNHEFQDAMAAPAYLEEFKGNVVAVRTGKFWDYELYSDFKKSSSVIAGIKKELSQKKLGKEDTKKYFDEEVKKRLTGKELKAQSGVSNSNFHYLGAAKIMAQIGQAFADAMVNESKE